ncbi:MAG TPA: carboxypeptidase regulatory-like domain-containing protein [Bryobacteraceae bacterium]|nr:carboxypeptidase regulatory-like domain-containing protein [Bryobacteraceae bacterium]
MWKPVLVRTGLIGFCAGLLSASLAQTTIATGSIQGTVSDPSGAVVPGATITITSKTTGHTVKLASSSAGTYNSGALTPGEYTVRVEAPGFSTAELTVTVQVGVTTPGNIELRLGTPTSVVQVTAETVAVNTEQPSVQSVITSDYIANLPFGARNFLDLAQLAPGVQIQDAGNFMPTKVGFSSVSFGGRWGQTARISLDGLDVSDEFFGTTTQDIPANAIGEFQLSQSMLDFSTGPTSSGAVNVVTKSGSNQFHAGTFALARFHNTAARIGRQDRFFRRWQYGAQAGGPLAKDKVFLFAAWEHPRQDLFAPVELNPPFAALSGGFTTPFREHSGIMRLDWQIRPNYRVFARISYNRNDTTTAVQNTYQPFRNISQTPVYAGGADFNTGTFTHSLRSGYTRNRIDLLDAVPVTRAFNPAPGIAIAIGNSPVCGPGPANLFCSGPSFIAPQLARQRNLQTRYDGSKVAGSHVLRYGAEYNRIRSVAIASLLGAAPQVLGAFNPLSQNLASAGPFPGGASNPLNYPVVVVAMGNRAGFLTERPQFGYPGGGVLDDRIGWYVGDTWKLRRNLNLNFGVRYLRDTGRTDSDLPPLPVLDRWQPGLGRPVKQPNRNFAPQFGFAWDPWNRGRTAIRGGIGMFYENLLHANTVFNRLSRLERGIFNGIYVFCPSPSLRMPDGSIRDVSHICFQPIGTVARQIAALQEELHAQTMAVGPQSNPQFVGATLSSDNALFAPDFHTPYSLQMNLGLQHQLAPGLVLSADYVRNVGVHFLLSYDVNHVGDARFLNRSAALNAMNTVHSALGCAGGAAGVDCAIARGVTIADYARAGLDSSRALFNGMPSLLFGLPPERGAAFPGRDPALGQLVMLFPMGRSVYNALQLSFRGNLNRPAAGLHSANFQLSYTLSRFVSPSVNQDFQPRAVDYRNALGYVGPNSLDRTHQFSFGGWFELPRGVRLSMISHVKTAVPVTLRLPQLGLPGEIFRTDTTGDGTTGDLLPGTKIGAFGRSIRVSNLNDAINQYNARFAGKLTPAAQALVDAGLFSSQQLIALGAVMPALKSAPAGQVGIDSLMTTDVKLSWVWRILKQHESLTLEPSVAIYNMLNIANYDPAGATLSGVLDGSPGSVNGTPPSLRINRVTFGYGMYSFGAPRVFEWGLKLTF